MKNKILLGLLLVALLVGTASAGINTDVSDGQDTLGYYYNKNVNLSSDVYNVSNMSGVCPYTLIDARGGKILVVCDDGESDGDANITIITLNGPDDYTENHYEIERYGGIRGTPLVASLDLNGDYFWVGWGSNPYAITYHDASDGDLMWEVNHTNNISASRCTYASTYADTCSYETVYTHSVLGIPTKMYPNEYGVSVLSQEEGLGGIGYFHTYTPEGQIVSYASFGKGSSVWTTTTNQPAYAIDNGDSYILSLDAGFVVGDDYGALVEVAKSVGGHLIWGDDGITACSDEDELWAKYNAIVNGKCRFRGDPAILATTFSDTNGTWCDDVVCGGPGARSSADKDYVVAVQENTNIWTTKGLRDQATYTNDSDYALNSSGIYDPDNGLVYTYHSNDVLYAHNVTSNETVWNEDREDAYYGAVTPSITPDYLLLVTTGNLTAKDKNTGDNVATWTLNLNYATIQPRFVTNGGLDYLIVSGASQAADTWVVYYLAGNTSYITEDNETNTTNVTGYFNVSGNVYDLDTDAAISDGRLRFCRWCNIQFKCLSNTYVYTGPSGYYTASNLALGEYYVYVDDVSGDYGTTVEYEDFGPYTYSGIDFYTPPWTLNASVVDRVTLEAIANATIRVFSDSHEASNYTNSSGHAKILLREYGVYNVSVTAPGYGGDNRVFNYSESNPHLPIMTLACSYGIGGRTCQTPQYLLDPADQEDFEVNVTVVDTIYTNGIHGASVHIYNLTGASCATYQGSPPFISLTTNASGQLAPLNLTRGSYAVEVDAPNYTSYYQCPKVVNRHATWAFALDYDSYHGPMLGINGTFYKDGAGAKKLFTLRCSMRDQDGTISYQSYDVIPNENGDFEQGGIQAYTGCRVIVDGFTLAQEIWFAEENITNYAIRWETTAPYEIFVGDLTVTNKRILGSTINIYSCDNDTFNGVCSFVARDIDDRDELLAYWWPTNTNISIRADREGYFSGWDNFTANTSDPLIEKIRVIALTPADGNCSVVVYFNSDDDIPDDTELHIRSRWVDENGVLFAAQDMRRFAVNLKEGLFFEELMTCGSCATVEIVGDAKFYTERWGLQVTGGEWYWSRVYDEELYVCAPGSGSIYDTYNVTLAPLESPDVENTDTNINQGAWGMIMGSFDESTLFGSIARQFLTLFGFDPDMPIILVALWLVMMMIFAMFLFGFLAIVKQGIRDVF